MKYVIEKAKLQTLHKRREDLCRRLFKEIMTNKDHKLFRLIKQNAFNNINLRKKNKFILPNISTNRYKQNFINYGLYNFQQ